MLHDSTRRAALGLLAGLLIAGTAAAQPGLVERTVAGPTRLDWAFAAQGFGPAAAKLPAGYDSTKQRYRLHVPKGYRPDRAWPLVLFIAAGDAPGGWSAWQAACEAEGAFFCAPAGAGNGTPAGPRTRIILDALDDVRRAYRIDPDQTYLTGFSGGARMACAIGFALPEYVGGLAPLCGTNPPAGPTYLRHRLQGRVSVALVTGETDTNRAEHEVYLGPWLDELGVRTKTWVVPKMGHAIPSAAVLKDVYAWLKADLPRRRADAKARPALAVAPDEAPTAAEQVRRLVTAADAELKAPGRTWRGVALLQGAAQRGAVGQQARQRLQALGDDATTLERVADEGAKDEQLALGAQARALERFGQPAAAREAWALLAKNQPDTPAGRAAAEHIRRLSAAALPPAYLGLGLTDTAIDQLAPQGPAAKAGLKVGDVVTRIGDRDIASPDDLRQLLPALTPGDRVRVAVRRAGRPLTVTVEVGRRPGAER